jgi:hypothetical protein
MKLAGLCCIALGFLQTLVMIVGDITGRGKSNQPIGMNLVLLTIGLIALHLSKDTV